MSKPVPCDLPVHPYELSLHVHASYLPSDVMTLEPTDDSALGNIC